MGVDVQTEIHNRLAGDLVGRIVKPPLDAGGQYSDVLVLLESVALGVILVAAKRGGEEVVLDKLCEGIRTRLAERRLASVKPEGSA